MESPAGPVAQPPPELPVLPPTTPPISPTQATVAKLNEHTKQIKGKLTSLERENKLLKILFRMEQKNNSRMRKKLNRLFENKVNKNVREKRSKPQLKQNAVEKRKEVELFLSRDTNSRLLAGEKDTVGRVNKKQRRVLTKSLRDLHSDYLKDPRCKCLTGNLLDIGHFI